MPDFDDSTLMLSYAAGDNLAFEQLYKRHKDSLYRYLLRQSGQATIAEDIAQEVWAKVIAARQRYRPDAKFTTFLFRIARNAFIDHLRRNRMSAVSDTYEEESSCDPTPTAESTLDKASLNASFRRALLALPDDQRDAFLLREESGLSLEEIASVCGVNRETAKSRLRYAVNKLKTLLANELGLNSGSRHDK